MELEAFIEVFRVHKSEFKFPQRKSILRFNSGAHLALENTDAKIHFVDVTGELLCLISGRRLVSLWVNKCHHFINLKLRRDLQYCFQTYLKASHNLLEQVGGIPDDPISHGPECKR